MVNDPRQPRSILNRADLLRVLGIDDPGQRARALAAVAGLSEPAPAAPSDDLSPAPLVAPEPTRREFSQTGAASELAPALFWRAIRLELRETLEVPRLEELALAKKAAPEDHGQLPPPVAAPLLSTAQLLTTVRRHSSTHRKTQELDLNKAVERISCCQRLEPLPMRRRRMWGGRVLLIFDQALRLTPYWRDQELVFKQLQRVYPKDGIALAICNEHRREMIFPDELGRGRQLPPGVPVIAVTDLGCLAASDDDWPLQFWRRWGKRFRDNRNPAYVLLPTVPALVARELHELWSIIPWTAAPPSSLLQRDSALEKLLAMISPATRLEPGLLRTIRRLIPECKDDPGLEALVWQHKILSSRHQVAATLDPEEQSRHRRRLAKLPAELRNATMAAIESWHAPQFPLLCATSVISVQGELSTNVDFRSVERARKSIVAFDAKSGDLSESASARIWWKDLEARTMNCEFVDLQLLTALNSLHERLGATEGARPAPQWVDPRISPSRGDEPFAVRVSQIGDQLRFERLPEPSSAQQEAPAGSPLAALTTHGGQLVLGSEAFDPFWNSGRPPAWASAWGSDRYGAWAEFRVRKAVQRMRWIKPGRFLMGSPESEEGRWDDEGPVHEVTITNGFWLFDTPCCQDLYEEVCGLQANLSDFRGPRRPVENVTWDDAVAFAAKLNEVLPGLELRLPREAEWEFACRAGTTGPRFGALDDVAWYGENSDDETHEVGLKLANPWGLFDILGNVWEWCSDYWGDYTRDNAVDPQGPASGARRVIRGGGWSGGARYVRAAHRGAFHAGSRLGDLGFRCLSSGMSAEPGIEAERSGAKEASGASASESKKTRKKRKRK